MTPDSDHRSIGLTAKPDALHEIGSTPLSASCSAEERARGLAVGGDDFIRKPFEPADLVTRVRSHLQRVAVLRRPKSG